MVLSKLPCSIQLGGAAVLLITDTGIGGNPLGAGTADHISP
jgi:hypothetical protein